MKRGTGMMVAMAAMLMAAGAYAWPTVKNGSVATAVNKTVFTNTVAIANGGSFFAEIDKIVLLNSSTSTATVAITSWDFDMPVGETVVAGQVVTPSGSAIVYPRRVTDFGTGVTNAAAAMYGGQVLKFITTLSATNAVASTVTERVYIK